MSSVELCPGLQYPFLKSPSWHCRSGLCGPLLLTNTLLLLKTEVLTAVVTTPSHYFCLWSPPFHSPKQKDRNTSSSSFLWLWCGLLRKEVNVFPETVRETWLQFLVICWDLQIEDIFTKQLSKQMQVFGHSWRCVLGSTTRSSVMLAQFKINRSNKHGIIQRIDPFTCLRRAHASSQAVSTCKIPLYYCY